MHEDFGFLDTPRSRQARSLFQSKHELRADKTTALVQGIAATEAKQRAEASATLRAAREAKEACDPDWAAARNSRIKAARKAK